jgi:nitronate monooxygenase
MGTRLIATREADIHEDYKQRLVAADEHSTVYTHCFNQDWDAMHRVLRNDTFLGWEAAGCPIAGSKPGEGDIVANHPQLGPVVRYNTMPPLAGHVGQVGDMALYAGTGVARIGDVPPAAELVQRLWREAQGAAPV